MSSTVFSIIPDPEALLALEPEELAGVVLECLNSLSHSERGQLNRYNFSLPHTVEEYPRQYQNRISQALMEAWVWLEREGLIAPKPGSQGEWVFITRRGVQITNASDLEAYRRADILPKRILHPVIAQKVWSPFIRGDYDTAVFQAFKEVEIRVRTVSSLPQELIGTDLMRKAFHSDDGKLTDITRPKSEKEAMGHLFAGAIGLFKNPSSHRDVNWGDPSECAELIYLANHLLRMVGKRGKEIQNS